MAATVSRVWSDDTVNLVILPDGSNDLHLPKVPNPLPIRWETSVRHGTTNRLQDIINAEWHTLSECALFGLGLSAEAV